MFFEVFPGQKCYTFVIKRSATGATFVSFVRPIRYDQELSESRLPEPLEEQGVFLHQYYRIVGRDGQRHPDPDVDTE